MTSSIARFLSRWALWPLAVAEKGSIIVFKYCIAAPLTALTRALWLPYRAVYRVTAGREHFDMEEA